MRHLIGLTALAVIALQPAVASAAPATRAPVAGTATQGRQETIRLALLQSQGQGANQDRDAGDTPPGRVRRTTVLSNIILFMAPAAALAGLAIALGAGGGKKRAISM